MSCIRTRISRLVARAIDGDRDAIAALHAHYNQRLLAIAQSKLGRTLNGLLESADLVQSVWADVLPVLHRFEDRREGAFFHWLHTCLLHKVSQARRYHNAEKRAANRLSSLSDAPEPPATRQRPPSEEAELADDLIHVLEELERFPRVQREVLLMHDRDGMTFPEIAPRIGKSVEATKKLHQRSLAHLADRFTTQLN